MNSPDSRAGIPGSGELAARTARLIFYVLLAIVLMTLDYRGRYVERVHALAYMAVEPLVLVIEAPFRFADHVSENWRSREHLLDRMYRLEQRARDAEAELMLLDELRRENRELRALLDASDRPPLQFRAGELMSVDLNPWSHRVVINRGSRDGLAPGQAVLDGNGVLGQVDRVGLHSAQVILITDPDHALPVSTRRTGFRTIAYGSGRINRLRLTDLPMNVDLAPGDRLVTSGLAGGFPAGLPVAEVEAVERQPGEAFARARARPLGELDRARHVLIVLSSEGDEAAAEAGDGP